MDPQATLTDLLQAVADRDWDRVDELAEALLAWIGKGGFPPRTIGPETLPRSWHVTVAEFLCDLAKSKARLARKRRPRRKERP